MKLYQFFLLFSCFVFCSPKLVNGQSYQLDSASATYRQFFFRGTHNSYSGNLDGMRREGIKTQLDSGLRFFEFDLFPYYTERLLQQPLTTTKEQWIVMEKSRAPYLLSYDDLVGSLKLFRLEKAQTLGPTENAALLLSSGKRCFLGLTVDTLSLLFSHHPNSGKLDIIRVEDSTLLPLAALRLQPGNLDLSAFTWNGDLFLGIQDLDNKHFSIKRLGLTDAASVILGETTMSLTSIPKDENLLPFVQNDRLYLLHHRADSTAVLGVTPLNTSGAAWSCNRKISIDTGMPKGKLQISYTPGGALFLNLLSGDTSLSARQLLIDNGEPQLPHAYSLSTNLTGYAYTSVFPAIDGCYLLSEGDDELQVMAVHRGTLTLGHDAPGDEVDLSVDNPQSIFLSDWLAYMADWSNKHPDHEPLFIMTELKDYREWLAGAEWQEIIGLMQQHFGSRLRYHYSRGFHTEPMVDKAKIVDGATRYFTDENGKKEGGLLGKVVLYIQPNISILDENQSNKGRTFSGHNSLLQAHFLQLRRYREDNKLISPDWRSPERYGSDIGAFIRKHDRSYTCRIFHMQSHKGNEQYEGIRCAEVMFAVSDRPYDPGPFAAFVAEQRLRNNMQKPAGCND